MWLNIYTISFKCRQRNVISIGFERNQNEINYLVKNFKIKMGIRKEKKKVN